MSNISIILRAVIVTAAVAACAPGVLADALVTFEDGTEGWIGPTGPGGSTFIDAFSGNPPPSMHTRFEDFGIVFYNLSEGEFIGDYTESSTVTLSIDVYVRSILFFLGQVQRDFIVELRDYDDPEPGYLWTSVWYTLGTLDASDPGWHTLSVTIGDTTSVDLPPGWGGYGAEDPVTFEPVLPAGRSFTDVISGVDVIVFSTLVPGYFYGFSYHDVEIDNLTIDRCRPDCDPSSMAACPATDVNCDDVSDGFDIAAIRNDANWLRGNCEAAEPRADVNRDGFVDGFDVARVRSSLCWLQ